MAALKSSMFRVAERLLGTRVQEWRWRRGNFDGWVSEAALEADPHRPVLLDIIEAQGPIGSLLEVGCNWGPNLILLRRRMPDVVLHGIDINARSIGFARRELSQLPGPPVDVRVGSVFDLPYADASIDVVVTDVMLTYVGADRIVAALDELLRVTRRALVLCEFHSGTQESVNPDGHWLHPYPRLIGDRAVTQTQAFPAGALDVSESWDCGAGWRAHAAITIATPVPATP